MEQRKPDLEQLVREHTVDGRLTCAVAHQLAERWGFTLMEVGKVANSLGIKISKCQLGCF